MARYLSRILKVMLFALVGVGGGAGLMTFIALVLHSDQQTAVEIGLQSALVIGLSFGTIVATALVLTDLTMRLSLSGGKVEDLWELEQTREVEMTGSIKDVKRKCREALLGLPDLKSVSEDADESSMTASVGRSWRSPGEEVKITIAKIEEGRFRITCHSACVHDRVGFDYAKNFENVETWLKRMNKPD